MAINTEKMKATFKRVNERCKQNNTSIAELMELETHRLAMQMKAHELRNQGYTDDEIKETLTPMAEQLLAKLNEIRERKSLGKT